MIVASNAGLRAVRGTAAAAADFPGIADLGVIDVMCLHSVNHRERAKKLADICRPEYRGHIVNYALKKLVKAGLVTSQKQGKEAFYETSDTGKAVIRRYRDIREACLVDAFPRLARWIPTALASWRASFCVLSGLIASRKKRDQHVMRRPAVTGV